MIKFYLYDHSVVAREAILCQNRSRCFVRANEAPYQTIPQRRASDEQ